MDVQSVIAWAAPIASTIIVTFATAVINARIKEGEKKRDAARAEAEAGRKADQQWRDSITARMDEQEGRIDILLSAQCSQMRSDAIHKCHRYLDDLGCASVEEKAALHEEYEDYQALCTVAGVENHLIDKLMDRVMALPEREV